MTMNLLVKLLFLSCGVLGTTGFFARAKSEEKMMLLPAGQYIPFFQSDVLKKGGTSEQDLKKTSRKPVAVESFWMDQFPVTVGDYLLFVKKNPHWQKSKAKSLFVDPHYLESWKSDLNPSLPLKAPVTNVSWFAAKAYCEWLGKSLPSIDQWEYAAYDLGREQVQIQQKILQWYGKPNSSKVGLVGKSKKNGFGIYDLYGLIWEWTFDFNSLMVSSESRGVNSKEAGLFCGSGSLNALDPSDYAAFMRFSLRNSLQAKYTTANLGFRCIKEVSE